MMYKNETSKKKKQQIQKARQQDYHITYKKQIN
jgi:hypothetical protein